MYYQRQYRPRQPQRPQVTKLQPSSKILISTIVAILAFIITHGHPKKVNHLTGLGYVDTSVQEIFETTIAVQKKRFIKRIVAQSEGIWKMIPYVNHPKWADLQITITTRIGFDIRNAAQAGFTPEGKLMVDFFQPTILSKHWQTKIVDSSDHLFSKWNIRQFKEKQAELLQELTSEESMQILDSFKNDANKMSELAYRLDQKLSMSKAGSYSPMYWLDNVNRLITSKLDQFSSSFTLTNNYSTPQILKKRSQQEGKMQRQSNKARPSSSSRSPRGGQNARNTRKVSSYKQISYSEAQDKIRRQMKTQLNM